MDPFDQWQAAKGYEEREAILLQILMESLSSELRRIVVAAAIPHWFDIPFLEALLNFSGLQNSGLYTELTELSFVKRYPGRGYAIHNRTRRILRNDLWHSDRDTFLNLSQRAAGYCNEQTQEVTYWRIETIFHELAANPQDAEQAFIKQCYEYYDSSELAKVEALISPVLSPAGAGQLPINAIGWAYLFRSRIDFIFDRYEDVKRSLNILADLRIEDHVLEGLILQTWGDLDYYSDQFIVAEEKYEQSLTIFQDSGWERGQAHCLKKLADINLRSYKLGLAKEQYEQSILISHRIGDYRSEAQYSRELGVYYRKIKNYPKSRKILNDAMQLSQKINYRLGEMNAVFHLADLDRLENIWNVAIEKYEKSLAYYTKAGMTFNQALTNQHLGQVHEKIGNFLDARRYYESSLALFTQINSPGVQDVQKLLENLPEKEN